MCFFCLIPETFPVLNNRFFHISYFFFAAAAAGGSSVQRATRAAGFVGVGKHHHKRHLSRSSSSSSAADGSPPGNALINELGSPANMFVTANGTVVTSQIGGTAILPCATAKLGTATVSTRSRVIRDKWSFWFKCSGFLFCFFFFLE